jgi:hypothetical protein
VRTVCENQLMVHLTIDRSGKFVHKDFASIPARQPGTTRAAAKWLSDHLDSDRLGQLKGPTQSDPDEFPPGDVGMVIWPCDVYADDCPDADCVELVEPWTAGEVEEVLQARSPRLDVAS